MNQDKCIRDLEQSIAECEDALRWSKTSKFVKHHKKIQAIGFFSIVAMSVWGVSSVPDFENLNTIAKVLWITMVCMMSTLPAWLVTWLIPRMGMSILKCKQYAVWEDCLRDPNVKSDREVEIKEARHKFMNILKANNIDGTSEVIQRLKKLEKQTGLSKFFWNMCYNIFKSSDEVQDVDIEKEWGNFVEVVDVAPKIITTNSTVKILKL